MLTLVHVLWALDSRAHLSAILHYLAQLQTLDPLRHNYYADMSECWPVSHYHSSDKCCLGRDKCENGVVGEHRLRQGSLFPNVSVIKTFRENSQTESGSLCTV